jgi:hypothetical protein
MKRLAYFPLALIIAFYFPMAVITATATELITFTAGTNGIGTAKAGDRIELPILVTNNPGLAGVEISVTLGTGLEWDYNPLAYSNASSASATWPYIPGNSVRLTGRPSAMGASTDFAFLNFDAVEMESFNSVGNGVLLSLKLKVSENVAIGSALTVGLAVRACGSVTRAYLSREFTTVNGTIIAGSVLYGDANGDGFINAADVTMLRRYIAASDKDAFVRDNPNFILVNADVNGDGTIDSADVTLLRRYLAAANPATVLLGPQLST